MSRCKIRITVCNVKFIFNAEFPSQCWDWVPCAIDIGDQSSKACVYCLWAALSVTVVCWQVFHVSAGFMSHKVWETVIWDDGMKEFILLNLPYLRPIVCVPVIHHVVRDFRAYQTTPHSKLHQTSKHLNI